MTRLALITLHNYTDHKVGTLVWGRNEAHYCNCNFSVYSMHFHTVKLDITRMKMQDYFNFRILKQVDVLIGYEEQTDRDPGAVQSLDVPDVPKNTQPC